MSQTLRLTSEQRKLISLYAKLSGQEQASLMAFAEFLHARCPAQPKSAMAASPLAPKQISRPANESVVAAIKRLASTYYMLERAAMLDETSSLMTAHIMQGRPAGEVIDDLEKVFAQQYQRYKADRVG